MLHKQLRDRFPELNLPKKIPLSARSFINKFNYDKAATEKLGQLNHYMKNVIVTYIYICVLSKCLASLKLTSFLLLPPCMGTVHGNRGDQ